MFQMLSLSLSSFRGSCFKRFPWFIIQLTCLKALYRTLSTRFRRSVSCYVQTFNNDDDQILIILKIKSMKMMINCTGVQSIVQHMPEEHTGPTRSLGVRLAWSSTAKWKPFIQQASRSHNVAKHSTVHKPSAKTSYVILCTTLAE
jgi:hypothetical protein